MAKTAKNIAITGPFADVNFGDYAMLVNNIFDLGIENIRLFSYDDKFLYKIQSEYLEEYNTEIIEVRLKEDHLSSFELDYNLTPFEILDMIDNYESIKEKIIEIDLLVVNGGGYFNGLWSMPHRIEKLIKIITPILIANNLGKEIYFTGNSYGPFGDAKEFFSIFFNTLNNVKIGSRDNLYSPMWMNQICINKEDIKYIPDDLFLINEKLLNYKKHFSIKSDNYIVMETYLPIEFIKNNIEVFKDFSNEMYERHGLSIVFLPLNLEHGGMHQAEYLNDFLKNYEFININDKGYLPIQDAVEIIQNANLVISSRYHALVVALSVETPTISVLKNVMKDKRYYYNKNLGMLNLALAHTDFEEKYYIGLDYLETLNFVKNNFKNLIDHQNSNYNEKYKENVNNLKSLRMNYINEILSNN